MANLKSISGYNEDMELTKKVDSIYREYGTLGQKELESLKEETINDIIRVSKSSKQVRECIDYRAVNVTANDIGAFIVKQLGEAYLEVLLLKLTSDKTLQEIGTLRGVSGSRIGAMVRRCRDAIWSYIVRQSKLNSLLELDKDYTSELELRDVRTNPDKTSLILEIILNMEDTECSIAMRFKRKLTSYVNEGEFEKLYDIVSKRLLSNFLDNKRYFYSYNMEDIERCLGTANEFKERILELIPSTKKKTIMKKDSSSTKQDIELLVNYVKGLLPTSVVDSMSGNTDRERVVGYIKSLQK